MKKKWWHGYVRIGRWGMLAGFILGIARALDFVAANRYLPQGLYRIALESGVKQFNGAMLFALLAVLALAVIYHTYYRFTRNSWRTVALMLLMGIILFIISRVLDANIRHTSMAYGMGSFKHLAATAYYSLREGGIGVLAINIVIIWAIIAVAGWILYFILRPLRRLRDVEFRAPIILDRIAGVFVGAPALALILIVFLAANIWASRVEAGRKPENNINLILISIDTLRADHVGAYCLDKDIEALKRDANSPADFVVCDGYRNPVTPTLDQFAAQGVFFDEAYVQAPWTLPSHASMLTSLYPSVHRTDTYFSFLPKYITTLPERLWDRGYSTGAVTSHIFLSAMYGLDQGFETLHYQPDAKADWVSKRAVQFLKDHKSRPFFLFVHFFDPHTSYTPPRENAEKFTDPNYIGSITVEQGAKEGLFQQRVRNDADLRQVIALYDGEVNFVDDQIGVLLKALDDLGLMDKTFVLITADHGEEFLDHGGWEHSKLYDECVHVPLIMRLPGFLPQGLRVKSQVRDIDILPTFMDLARIPLDPLASGESLLPLAFPDQNSRAIVNRPAYGEKNAAVEDNQNRYMLRFPAYKYIYNSKGPEDELYRIYDFQGKPGDPGERKKNNLVHDPAENKTSVDFLTQLWKYIETTKQQGDSIHQLKPPNQMKLDQETLDRLKSLGYNAGGEKSP